MLNNLDLIEAKMKKKITKFCVITTQRSGSAWLITLLDSHPELQAFREIFINDKKKDGSPREWPDKRITPFYEFRKHNLHK